MADVQPLRGIRYRSQRVGDLAQVVTPPFDVISEEDQARYYARSPYNVIRLEFGKEQVQDTTLDNRYTRAAATFAEWRANGVLRQETVPCYYLYQQTFTHNGQSYTRTGLLARVRLEPWSAKVVLPHELTHSKAKNDRLKLLRACAANFSPLMTMYDDPQGRIRRLHAAYAANAEVQITDEVGEGHRLHAITDAAQIARIQDFFAERQLYMADGHHRYETALNYRNEIREQRRHIHDDDAVNFVLMALIDVDDPGMLVLPTHRLLSGLNAGVLNSLFSTGGQEAPPLQRYFSVRNIGTDATSGTILKELAQAGEEQLSFALCTPEQNLLLSLNEQGRRRMMESGHAAAWNDLDVAVAHRLVLDELLGIREEDISAGVYVRYTRDAQQALEVIQAKEAQVALLLNATRGRQVRDVALADERMPHKSTYYYPKLITGLVINPLW